MWARNGDVFGQSRLYSRVATPSGQRAADARLGVRCTLGLRRLMLPNRSPRLLIPPPDEAIREVRPVSARLAPLGDLEDIAGGREVKRRVELASDRAGVVV